MHLGESYSLGTLKAVAVTLSTFTMPGKKISTYLITYRRRSGLTQRELARLLGYKDEGPISRHERGIVLPPLSVAFAYQAVFHVSVEALFPGTHGRIARIVERQIAIFKNKLEQKSAKGRDARRIARRIEWFYERENAG